MQSVLSSLCGSVFEKKVSLYKQDVALIISVGVEDVAGFILGRTVEFVGVVSQDLACGLHSSEKREKCLRAQLFGGALDAGRPAALSFLL